MTRLKEGMRPSPLFETAIQFPADRFDTLPVADSSPLIPLKTLTKNYYRENAPLANQLPYPEERGSLNEIYKNTSAHETQHALIAKAFGIKSSVSLERKGNSLGRTSFDGYIPLSKFKIIAAGGAVNTAGAGPAQGYGMDLYQISVANFLQNMSPDNVDPYILMAKSVLDANYTREVQIKSAEIIAYLGGTADIDLVLQQAEFELEMEGMNFDRFYSEREEKLAELKKKISLAEADDKRMVEIKLIEENEDHTLKIQWIEKDNPDIFYEEIHCPFCSGINMHFPICRQNRKKYDEDHGQFINSLINPEIENAPINDLTGLTNGDNGEIFSRVKTNKNDDGDDPPPSKNGDHDPGSDIPYIAGPEVDKPDPPSTN